MVIISDVPIFRIFTVFHPCQKLETYAQLFKPHQGLP